MSNQASLQPPLLIIGAGIGGLSTACYGQMNGWRTLLLEMRETPGGLCTSWQRGRYTIDGAINWTLGSAPGSGFYRVWEELGVHEGRQMADPEQFMHLEGVEGHTVPVFSDLHRFEQELVALAPEDEALIRRLMRASRAFSPSHLSLQAPALAGWMDRLGELARMLPVLVHLRDWAELTVGQLAARCRSTRLRQVLRLLAWAGEDFSVIFLVANLGSLHQRQAGYPMGGSLALSRAIESRLRALGGEVRYGVRVERILVEQGRAVGVRLEGGEELRAQAVVSAVDGHTTLFRLLQGQYVDEALRRFYEQTPRFSGLIQVALGVRRTFEDVPYAALGVSLPLQPRVSAVGREYDRLLLQIYNQDPSLAPAGCTVLKAFLESELEPWRALSESPERYVAEKERVADQVIAALERRFPGLASQVEEREVATPHTYARLTGNWHGSYEGWLPTPQASRQPPPRTLPGLGGFYMCGHWVQPGGGAALSALTGRQAIQMLCAAQGRPFVSWAPGEQPKARRTTIAPGAARAA